MVNRIYNQYFYVFENFAICIVFLNFLTSEIEKLLLYKNAIYN